MLAACTFSDLHAAQKCLSRSSSYRKKNFGSLEKGSSTSGIFSAMATVEAVPVEHAHQAGAQTVRIDRGGGDIGTRRRAGGGDGNRREIGRVPGAIRRIGNMQRERGPVGALWGVGVSHCQCRLIIKPTRGNGERHFVIASAAKQSSF